MRNRFRELYHNGAGIPRRTLKKKGNWGSRDMKEEYGRNKMNKSEPCVQVQVECLVRAIDMDN